MSTLKARVEECMRRNPGVSQAVVARAAGIKPPSVVDWLNGKTLSLSLKPACKAAALFGCDPLWLGVGDGLPNWRTAHANHLSSTPQRVQAPSFATALPVVLDVVAGMTPTRWAMMRAALDGLPGHPEMRDDVLLELLPLQGTESSKRLSGSR